jgi:hypothetical protein
MHLLVWRIRFTTLICSFGYIMFSSGALVVLVDRVGLPGKESGVDQLSAHVIGFIVGGWGVETILVGILYFGKVLLFSHHDQSSKSGGGNETRTKSSPAPPRINALSVVPGFSPSSLAQVQSSFVSQ